MLKQRFNGTCFQKKIVHGIKRNKDHLTFISNCKIVLYKINTLNILIKFT